MKRTFSIFLLVLAATAAVRAQNDKTFSTSVSTGPATTVTATRDVFTSGTVTVTSSANVTLSAGRKVVLAPGFSAGSGFNVGGGYFRAVAPVDSDDSDGDGMPDFWEIAFGLDHNNAADANIDSDGDGISNYQEFLAGTRPTAQNPVDTDGDGMPDFWEIRYGLNPNSNDAAADADSDWVSNLDEYRAGTDPRSGVDTDADGLPDAWEITHWLAINHADATPNADPDGDGITNLQEYRGGTNPKVADGPLKVLRPN